MSTIIEKFKKYFENEAMNKNFALLELIVFYRWGEFMV